MMHLWRFPPFCFLCHPIWNKRSPKSINVYHQTDRKNAMRNILDLRTNKKLLGLGESKLLLFCLFFLFLPALAPRQFQGSGAAKRWFRWQPGRALQSEREKSSLMKGSVVLRAWSKSPLLFSSVYPATIGPKCTHSFGKYLEEVRFLTREQKKEASGR